jgi:hypothetical protein
LPLLFLRTNIALQKYVFVVLSPLTPEGEKAAPKYSPKGRAFSPLFQKRGLEVRLETT